MAKKIRATILKILKKLVILPFVLLKNVNNNLDKIDCLAFISLNSNILFDK